MQPEIKAKTTIDPAEVEQFSRIADEWWDPHGKFKPLHDINPLRIEWIKKVISASCLVPGEEKNKAQSTNHKALQGVALLDIGCGGGLICEPMARLGASVTGIDASEKNIKVAALHAEKSGLEIDYRCMSAEELVPRDSCLVTREEQTPATSHQPPGTHFDIVLALEIIEHVADIPLFVESVCKLAKPGGLVFFSTINRTMKAYAMAIVGAEYVMRILPRGTHDWKKFVKPHELHTELRKHGVEVLEQTGMVLNPLKWQWELNAKDLDVNYLLVGKKSKR